MLIIIFFFQGSTLFDVSPIYTIFKAWNKNKKNIVVVPLALTEIPYSQFYDHYTWMTKYLNLIDTTKACETLNCIYLLLLLCEIKHTGIYLLLLLCETQPPRLTSACPYIHFLYTNVILIHHKDLMQGLSYTYTILYCFNSGLYVIYMLNIVRYNYMDIYI